MKDAFAIKGEVIDALESIADPGSDSNIVQSHVVESVDVTGQRVEIVLTVGKGWKREERFSVEDTIYEKVEAITGVDDVEIRTQTPQSANPKPPSADGAAPAAPAPHAPTPQKPSSSMPAAAPIEGVGQVLAVASGKGGVGKSTIAVNLALALQKLGHRVGLLDIDIYGPSLPTLLGVTERPNVSNGRILPLDVAGLRVMSLGFLMEDDTPVIWRGPIVTGIVRQFLRDVDWSGMDYLIVDLPPGTGDAQLALAQTVPVDGAIVVTTPSALALVDAARGLQMFQTLNIDVIGMVENMSKYVCPHGDVVYIFGKGTVEEEAQRLGTDYLGDIPIDPSLRKSGDEGEPIVIRDPESAITQSFLALAETVRARKPVGVEASKPEKKGLFSFLKS
jgi:ATP-binding protein involved in chromosome partitioning